MSLKKSITYTWKSLEVEDLNREKHVTLSLSRQFEYLNNWLGYFITI